MRLRIVIKTDNTGETLAATKVKVSTNPEDVRNAKEEAAQLVDEAVNLLIKRALQPLKENELREVIL